MTTIPRPRNADTGLTYYAAGKTYRVEYSTHGKRRYRSLRTDDINEARRLRDMFYKNLQAAGATYPDRRMKVSADDDKGIYPATGFNLKIHGKHIGHYATIEAARAAKRRYVERGAP
jgi:hypothetical protein